MLTADGLEAYTLALAGRQADSSQTAVAAGYETFLELNTSAKSLVSQWQQGGVDESATLGQLEDMGERVGEALRYAGHDEARFERYADRLDVALQAAQAGDERFVGDPGIDSFHTVWFECHEDFLLTLGLKREE
jgi:hypothetical protein